MKTQPTPNPNARKFIVNRELKREGKVTYTNLAECPHVPLAAALLINPAITQVHFFENVLTVSKTAEANWDEVTRSVEAVLQDGLEDHDPYFAAEVAKVRLPLDDASPEVLQIDEILDRTIRPGLQADGGDVEVVGLDGDLLTIRYEGACGGCPSSLYGTLEAIKGILREEFRATLEVVAI